ncbi:hypothetical protein Bpfe_008810 [Biomphalaria pfeifferi]|uniref:Uncharacterized protein n=1 Tax=Biomphalaria pfeifferi TaxID=112525 RepID=A0AAD8FEX2_BIOPF|nr:hypothetical protein Bpfe_008810 [Biomphalaria pfeifferi]
MKYTKDVEWYPKGSNCYHSMCGFKYLPRYCHNMFLLFSNEFAHSAISCIHLTMYISRRNDAFLFLRVYQ